MNSDVTANNTPTACNASNLSGVVSVNGAFSYYNPPPPESLINASTQITVCFSANHTYVSDLGFYLVGPAACGSPTIAVMPHPELINASNLCCCNSGDNLSNLCFTTNPLGNINPCTAAVPLNGTYSGYSSSFGNNVTINWSSLFGCNAAEGGWRVQIHDCIGQDVGALTNASITFSNLTSICGSPTSITYSSGAINSIINDNSCTAASASIFQVPITPNLTTPITINSSTTYLWTADQTVAIPNASSSLNTSVSTIPNGTTNLTLTATISYGSTVCTNNAVTTFNNTCCTATADAGADLSFCTGANSQLGTPALPNMTYLWSPATGLTDATIAQPTVTLINSGSTSQNTIYTLTVTNTVDGGCNDVDDIVVTVNPNITPTGLACYETAMFNTITCVWDVTGTQPVTPTVACYETAMFNTITCVWDVTGTQPVQPTLECYETTIFNTTTCVWDLTGTQPVQPTVACYETATFNTITCVWDVTGTQPVQPTLECYETATFNTITCVWDVTGMQPVQPTVACYETAMFNTITCVWDVTGTQPVQPTLSCYETTIFNATTCVWDLTGTQPVQPTVACYETATFNTITCVWDVTGTQPVQPILSCYETTIFNITTCVWDVTGTQPVQPTVACYETATFNTITCVWDVTGTQPVQPTVACYETATFNSTSCSWDVTGTEIINTTFISVCDDYTWANNGQTYTASGVYFGITTNCVSELLDLTITPSFTNTLSQTACDSYAWNGTTYTSSGVYIGTTANCVTESLDLTIIPNILPSFPQVGPYCSGATIPPLTTTSTNGISGSWLPAINNTAITTYTFTPTVGECAIIQTMSIFIAPILSSTNFVVICISDLPFLWNGNQYNETGIFTYNTSTAAGCDSVAILDITINPNPIASFTPSLNSFTETPQSIYFTNSSIGAISYSWDFGDGSYSTEVNPDHLYTDNLNGHTITLISESSEGCLGSSQITIEFIEGLIYYIPNTFTPDGDVYNQTFKPVFTSGFDPYNYEMLIFNRWGEILFETHDVTYGWDGKYALKNCQEGIYSYKITFKNPILDERKVVCGSINLLK
jgi:gliding motility-associated-like protein